MGRVFGRWLLASLMLGAVTGGLYGLLVSSTLGSPDEAAILSEASVAMILGVGLGLGSMLGVLAGAILGVLLGIAMAALNQRSHPTSATRYVRRVRLVAVAVPGLAGLATVTAAGRVVTLDVLPVLIVAVVWGMAASRIAAGYREQWPVDSAQ